MPKTTSESVARDVKLVIVAGKTPREAWETVGEPGGEAGIQNIRKQVREEWTRTATAADAANAAGEPHSRGRPTGSAATVASPAPVTPSPGIGKGQKVSFRRNSKQVDKQFAAEQVLKRKFINALKSASAEYQLALQTKAKTDAEQIARAHNTALDSDVQQLTGARIRSHTAQGLAGLSPKKHGPPPVIPATVVSLMATTASMKQLNGDEQKPRQLKRSAMALVHGTPLEQHLRSSGQKSKLMRRLRQSPVAGGGASLMSVPKVVVDNRRWMWLTYENVDRYFDGWKYFCLAEGFAEDLPEVQPDGATSKVTFSDFMKRRLSVGDETHQELSNVGDKSGPRASTFINPLIRRSGARHVLSPKHITSYIFHNAADEVGPFVGIFDSAASEEDDRRINALWTAGLPRVQAQFGMDHVYINEPIILVTPKGGTCEDALEKIIETALVPLYPDLSPTWQFDEHGTCIGGPICHRLDGGPGGTGTSSLPMRMRLAEKGILLFPSGPQNCTAATQEPDQEFGTYKSKCDDVTDNIVAERINARAVAESKLREASSARAGRLSQEEKAALPKVELSNADLPRVVNGRPDNPPEKRPFSYAFSRERIHKANTVVGAVPLTRAALRNPKVRQELGSTEEAGGVVKQIVTAHKESLEAGQALGLKVASMEVELPRRFEVVAPPSSEEEIILKLKDAGCSQASQWINCGAVAFNAAVINKAGVAIVKDTLDKKTNAAAATLASFTEVKEEASAIWHRMYEEEIGSYEDLPSGEPKVLVQFYFKATGEKGVTAACASVKEQIAFLDNIEDETFEELLKLEAPRGYKPVDEVDSVAAKLLTDMSTSMKQTLKHQAQSERESVLALTNLAGAVDEEKEPDVGQTIDAVAAGFDSSLLSVGAHLVKLPPSEQLLKFQSAAGTELKGREIVRRFKDEGWCVGRVLKQATDASVKDPLGKRVANYRVFYECDDELLNQALYPNNYAKGASSAVGSWMLIAEHVQAALGGPAAVPLALTAPQ